MPDGTTSIPPVGAEGAPTKAQAESLPGQDYAGFPLHEGMCLSGWLETVRYREILDHRTTEDLPKTADIIIIGSGASGSLTALELLKKDKNRSIVVLEARELCSGATGRNAGHCKPDQWRGFTKYNERHGTDQALKILANEQKTWQSLVKYVNEHKVDCELWVGKTLDVLMTEDLAKDAAKNMAAYKAAGGEVSKIKITTDYEEAEKVSKLKGAKAVYAWDASTLHPWKLIAHVAQSAIDLGLNLQTWTPVRGVTASTGPNTPDQWDVKTDRGTITAPIVIHATNAYAGAILPEVKGIIQPTPHMCNRTVPPSSASGSKALQNSYAVVVPGGLHSVNPRINGDGKVLFGGWIPAYSHLIDYVGEDETRRTKDDVTDFEPVTDAVRKLTKNHFEWENGDYGSKLRFDYAWSGIIGRSPDMVPFIGKVPNKPGQWMIAGHNGHGMARIFTCAPGLAKLVDGASWADTDLPECFEVTPARLDGLRGKTMADDD